MSDAVSSPASGMGSWEIQTSGSTAVAPDSLRTDPLKTDPLTGEDLAPRARVLIVDDERGPREALRMILKEEFAVTTADGADAAVAAVRQEAPDAILMDIRMGRVDGIEALRMIRAVDSTAQVAMITAYASLETARLAMQLGAADYITKPFDMKAVRDVVRRLVSRRTSLQQDTHLLQSLREANASLARMVSHYQELMQTNFTGTVGALIQAIDAKDRFTRDHSVRVSQMAVALAEELSFPARDIEDVRIAGLIHDIGKIGISEAVLRKEGHLTSDEWLEMKKHPSIGAEIISAVPALTGVVSGVLEHHERPDGKGYPRGLTGSAISRIASLLAVADSIDAMSSDRVYRRALAAEQIMDELLMGSGTQWRPDVVEAAIRIRLPRRRHDFQVLPGPFPFALG